MYRGYRARIYANGQLEYHRLPGDPNPWLGEGFYASSIQFSSFVDEALTPSPESRPGGDVYLFHDIEDTVPYDEQVQAIRLALERKEQSLKLLDQIIAAQRQELMDDGQAGITA